MILKKMHKKFTLFDPSEKCIKILFEKALSWAKVSAFRLRLLYLLLGSCMNRARIQRIRSQI